MPKPTALAKAISNYPVLENFLKEFSTENQKRLLLQAGAYFTANENFYIMLELQKILEMKNEGDFKKKFGQLASHIKQGGFNFPSEVISKLEALPQNYSRSQADAVLELAIEKLLGTIQFDLVRKVDRNNQTLETILAQRNTKREQYHLEASLQILQTFLPEVEQILAVIRDKGDLQSIRQAMHQLDIGDKSVPSQRMIFEMVARDLLMNNNADKINQFLTVAHEHLKADPKELDIFMRHISEDMTGIAKNHAVFVATQFFLHTLDPKLQDFFISKTSSHFSYEETNSILRTYAESLMQELDNPLFKSIAKENNLQINEAIKSLNKIVISKKPPEQGYLSGQMAEVLDKLRSVDADMNIIKRRAYLVQYATRLENSYLYQHKSRFGHSSQDKKSEKDKLKQLINEINALKKEELDDPVLVEKKIKSLEAAAENVRKASSKHHTEQKSHRIFGGFKLTEKFVQQTSKTEKAIENAKQEAQKEVSPSYRR